MFGLGLGCVGVGLCWIELGAGLSLVGVGLRSGLRLGWSGFGLGWSGLEVGLGLGWA